MRNALTVIFVLLFAAAAQAQKEAPLPKDLPPYGTQPAFQPPEVKATKLDNGLMVWLVAQPGLPKVSFRVVVLGGLAADASDRPGLSELLARTLSQGTKTRSAKQIAEEIQSAGGDLSVGADRDSISVSTSVLSSKTELAAGLLADMLRNASFPDGEVALAKSNLSNSLREREAQPGFQANRALARVLFGSGPYSVIAPTQDSLGRMASDELRQEFARRFRPDQAILVAVGDFDAAKMTEMIREKLGGWRAPTATPATVNAKPARPVRHEVTFVARPNSVQTTLVLAGFGPLRGDPDYEAAEVADAIYGGTFTSRLVTNIREDKGYTYSPGSNLATLRQAAVFRTQADVRNAVTGASLNEILYEMNRMATTSPTDEELSRAKRYLLGIEAILLQSRSAVAGELADLWLNGLGPDAIASYNRKVSATTAEDVDAVARKYFPASRMTIVAVGEEKVIRDALAPFALPMEGAK
ncbi:MAG TPA: pitrilysin family protein [Candidatus Acidoferrum sp.]|jgi:zinc protease|nr:pitrilysin family protein [Candidatus Acidoferrum sp.]